MKRVNEWEKLANQVGIQKTKNDVLNTKVISLVKEYAPEGTYAFDYGCGWGEFAQLLSDEGYKTFAFDQSDEMIKNAKNKFSEPIFLFRREFENGACYYLRTAIYDVVVSNLVLCILTEKDQEEMLKNIKSLVKSNGTIVLSFCHPCFDYHEESFTSIRKAPSDARYDKEFEYEKEIKENGMKFHDFHRSLSYYSNIFKKNDLAIIEISESELFGSLFYPDFITFVLKKK